MRFAFGANWKKFNKIVDSQSIAYAVSCISQLVDSDKIQNKEVLDIGSGSGINALAFLRLGAKKVTCFDVDLDSVEATQSILQTYYPDKASWKVFQGDILDVDPGEIGRYDLVYSWGVLHHTGNLHKAIENASTLCKSHGLMILALYRRTRLDSFWRFEKRIYLQSNLLIRSIIESIYVITYLSASLIRGRNIIKFVINYKTQRGMNFLVDIRDWLGGYPFETIQDSNLIEILRSLGFELEKAKIGKANLGIFGSGCDEFVFRKK